MYSNLLLKFKARFANILSILVFSLTLSACLKDDDDINYNDPIPGTLVAIVHASPDAGDLLVGINGNRVNNQRFDFGNRIMYQLLYPGAYQFQVNSAKEDKVLDVKNWNLEPGMCYTIFTIDRLDSLKLLGVRDFRYGDQPDQGAAKIRFINLCPDSLSLDVQADGIDTLLASGKKFKENTAFGNISTSGDASYTLHILNHQDHAALSSITFKPEEGRFYTIMAKGFMDTEEESQKFGAIIFRHD